ncbi:hypothetical protein [Sphingobium lignivorans]|uniref:YD repeat-containing protein n=1 Tax=Sphingobium lignivorans TaxID=2735886 RepID=A0ABR6NH78_9SPHN|nr:hypothetical protein [Sphingobium lignivorans]MBB5986635.1 hypothetical protein [Sphingobium lignivorans]
MKNWIILLGLATVLLPAVGGLAQTIGLAPPPKQPQVDVNGVDLPSGNIVYSRRELSIGPEGNMGLQLDRIYSGGTLRDNYSNLYSVNIDNLLGTVYSFSAQLGNNSDQFPDESASGNEVGPYGSGGGYKLNDGTLITYPVVIIEQWQDAFFSAFYAADKVTYPNGVQWIFHYKSVQSPTINYLRIQSVTSNTGYQIKFQYATNAMNGDFSNSGLWRQRTKAIAINNAYEYCDPLADGCTLSMQWPEVNYTYTSAGLPGSGNVNTVTATNNEGEAKYSSYSAPNLGMRIKEPGYAADNILYTQTYIINPCHPGPSWCMGGSPFRVTSATLNGVTTNYTYSNNSALQHWTVTASGPLSATNVYVAKYPGNGVIKWTDPLLRVSEFEYFAWTKYLTKAVHPEGNYSIFTNRPGGYLVNQTAYPKPGSGLAPVAENRTYPTDCSLPAAYFTCNKPLTITDPRGNVTSFTYSSAHGGVLTETGPAVNGIQPVTRFAYAQRYAWFKNSTGAYVQAATPVWVKTEERTCMATATVGNACAGGASDEVITSYEYGSNAGPNNLLLKALVTTANGITTRNCFGYDIYGNKISETGARAGLTACP